MEVCVLISFFFLFPLPSVTGWLLIDMRCRVLPCYVTLTTDNCFRGVLCEKAELQLLQTIKSNTGNATATHLHNNPDGSTHPSLSQNELMYRMNSSHLSSHVHGDTDDHGGDGDAGDESNADRGANQCSQLPQDLLLPTPRLLPPESTTRRTEEEWWRGKD